MITPLAAAKAYAAVQQTVAAEGGGVAASSSGPGFGEILKNAMSDAVKASKHAESQMAAQVAGKADLVDVATAISSAQTSLTTMIAVRDQMIQSYQQIMNMSI